MRLMQRMEAVAARRRLSPRTLEVYQAWVRRFLLFHRDASGAWRHPGELGGADVAAFLTYLAHTRKLSASSQNQAMNAILFVYRDVLGDDLGPEHLGPIAAERASRPRKVPTVPSADEVRRLIGAMRPGSMHRAMTELLYGCGLRLTECCTLRVRDVVRGRPRRGGRFRRITGPLKRTLRGYAGAGPGRCVGRRHRKSRGTEVTRLEC